jgi:SPP1 gp7 family putative phage head morphogenesis protein
MRTAGIPPQLARSRWRASPSERRALERERRHWERVRRSERAYGVQLRAVGRNVAQIIRGFSQPFDIHQLPELIQSLVGYAGILGPWANAVAERMIAEVTRRDASAWFKVSREIGSNLHQLVQNAPIGGVIRGLINDQVELIQSLPLQAATQAQTYTQEFVVSGQRYDELVDKILGLGDVTVNRATLIARTETAKAQSAIVEARAHHIGAEEYVWHTVRDNSVRDMHKRLEGSIQRWDSPPVAEANGERHHPGNFPNCRCWAEPMLPAVLV